MADPALPGRAVHLPIADIVLPRDERRKVQVAGTVLSLSAGPHVLLADCSRAAVFLSGQEVSARHAGRAEPAVLVDMRLILGDKLPLPARGDKVLVTGTLFPLPYADVPGTCPCPAEHEVELGTRQGWVLEAEAVLVQDVDVAAFDRTARRMAHHVALHTALQHREASGPEPSS